MQILSRRNFLKAGFLSSAVFVMNGCNLISIVTPIDTIILVQDDLFPKAKELNINTNNYIHLILNHSRITDADKEFIKNGVKWLNEEAVQTYSTTYIKLNKIQRQELLTQVSKTQWGDSWLYNMLSYQFEAMLGDPIYGSNNNEAGWKFLKFQGGLPRPTKAFL